MNLHLVFGALALVLLPKTEALCGNVVTNKSTGLIESSTLVNRPGELCRWTIKGEEGSVIKLSFNQSFDLAYYAHDGFCGDASIKLYDFLPQGEYFLRGVWCGTVAPPDMVSVSSTVEVRYWSGSGRGTGFSLSWSTVEKPSYTVLEGKQGNIKSPNYPNAYPVGQDHRWEIIVPFGHHVVLDFNLLDLGGKTNNPCTHDKMEIFNVLANNTLISLVQLCGPGIPSPIKSVGSHTVIDFHTDTEGNNKHGEGFSATWNSDSTCGGKHHSDKGLLASPNFPYLYGNNQLCKWTIQVTEGHAIALEFLLPFQLEDRCDSDYVKVFDVLPSGNRYLKGTWCGSNLPPTLTSSSFVIDVEFQTNDQAVYTGFSVSWSKVAKWSSQVLEGQRGNITSPNYPSLYPDSDDKRWEIIVPTSQYIVLELNTFDLGATENSGSCDHDLIEIFDVHPNNSLISLGQWCGSNAPPSLKSAGSRLFIEFHTDNLSSNNGQGFNVSWERDSACGAQLRTDRGFLSSPNYPQPYDDGQRCKWTINVTKGHLVKLEFLTPFEIEKCDNCNCDTVQVVDVMPNGDRHSRGTWCGSTPPPTLISKSSTIDVEFQSDNQISYRGFSVFWSSQVTYEKVSTVTASNEVSTTTTSRANNVTISPPTETTTVSTGETLVTYEKVSTVTAGNEVSTTTTSRANNVTISPPTETTTVSTGEKLDALCGNVITNKSTGLIESSTLVNRPGELCRWTIKGEEGSVIKLSFNQSFDLAYYAHDGFCGDASIKLYDFLPQGEYFLRGVWCGTVAPPDMVSVSSTVEVRYWSGSGRGTGFSLSWSTVEKPSYTVLEGKHGEIKLINKPSVGQDHRWEIIVPFGQYIVLDFNLFDVGGKTQGLCIHDKVEIFNVLANNTLISLVQLCGPGIPSPIKSVGSHTVIDFHTDTEGNNKHGEGFSATWNSDSTCGGKHHSDKGLLASPNFPYLYGNNQLCKWTIQVTEGHAIALEFLSPFHLEDRCDLDYIKVFDVLPSGGRYLKGTWCGSNLPPTLTSSSFVIDVEFQTNDQAVYTGFSASWSKVAKWSSQVLEGQRGNITSPNYPSPYPDSDDKRWEIIVPTGQYIVLEFNTFDLGVAENSGSCDHDVIEIFDVHPNNSLISLGQWCGSNAPPSLKSAGSRLFIEFHTDNLSSNNGQGFNVSWERDSACGAQLRTDRGFLSSPNYPQPYDDGQRCKWTINVTKGHLVKLEFLTPFEIEKCDNCNCDTVQVVDVMPNGDRHSRGTWCGSTPPPTLISKSSTIDVEFQSDNQISYRGFSVFWSSQATDEKVSTQSPTTREGQNTNLFIPVTSGDEVSTTTARSNNNVTISPTTETTTVSTGEKLVGSIFPLCVTATVGLIYHRSLF